MSDPPPPITATATAPPLPLTTVLSGLGGLILLLAIVGVLVTGGGMGYELGQARGSNGPTVLAAPVPATGVEPLGPDTPRAEFGPSGSELTPFAPFGPWTEVSGDWGQAEGEAVLLAPGGGRSLAVVVPARSPDAIEVRLATVAVNAGLVVRYRDPLHHVLLIAVADQGLWLVQVDGVPERPLLLTAVEGVDLTPGTSIGVRTVAGDLVVLVDGRAVARVPDPGVGPGFGLAAGGTASAASARFADLRAQPS